MMRDADMHESRWYCIQIKPGWEHRARRDVKELDLPVYDPVEKHLRRGRTGKDRKWERPVLPGYLFVMCREDGADWPRVRLVEGVMGFLGCHTTWGIEALAWVPVPVPALVIAGIQAREAQGEWDFEARELERRRSKRAMKRRPVRLSDLASAMAEMEVA